MSQRAIVSLILIFFACSKSEQAPPVRMKVTVTVHTPQGAVVHEGYRYRVWGFGNNITIYRRDGSSVSVEGMPWTLQRTPE